MRELEFLPAWYPRLRRIKRLLVLQTWLTIAIVFALSLWFVLAQRNVRAAEQAMRALSVQMDQTRNEQEQLTRLERLKSELQRQEQIVAQLGYPLEISRLLRTLDEVMPPEMSLKELTCTTEEIPIVPTGVTAAQARSERTRQVDRRMKVTLIGVAPNDVDLANFLAALSSQKFLEQIALLRADGRTDGGHVMREFEVTFLINLNAGQ